MQAPGLFPPPEDGTPEATRQRLVLAFVAAIAEAGYARATVADVVRVARVSKRTFYEHFVDKDACFRAAYALGSAEALRVTDEAARAAASRGAAWEAQLEAALRAYVAALEAFPALTRTCLLEIQAGGPEALELRRRVQEDFVALLRRFVTRARREHPDLLPLSAPMARAIVGGVQELVLANVERAEGARLANVADTALALVAAVVRPR